MSDLVQRLRTMFAYDPYSGMGEDRILLEAADALEESADRLAAAERERDALRSHLDFFRTGYQKQPPHGHDCSLCNEGGGRQTHAYAVQPFTDDSNPTGAGAPDLNSAKGIDVRTITRPPTEEEWGYLDRAERGDDAPDARSGDRNG